MCHHFLAVLLHPRHLSLPYFVAGIKLSLYFWPSEVSPDDLAVSFQFFFSLVGLPGTFGRDWVQVWFLVWSIQTPEGFLSPLPQFRAFKHMSTSLPIGVSINHTLVLKRVIRSLISVGVRHMLKFSSVLNGYFLELEPTFFCTIHLCSSTYLYCKLFCNAYMALWLFHKKPNWYITYLTSWTKELTLQDQFTSRGQSFWMGTSCHVVRSRKSKQLIHYHSTGFRNKTQMAERACLDFQTYCLSPHWSTFV